MQPDGTYTRATWPEGSFAFNCHRFFMENPSLSGRGSAGARDVPKLTHTDDTQSPSGGGRIDLTWGFDINAQAQGNVNGRIIRHRTRLGTLQPAPF